MTNYGSITQPTASKKKLGYNRLGNMAGALFLTVSFLVTFVCFALVEREEKQWLSVIPLGYFFISLLFAANFRNMDDNIPLFLTQALYFVRLVVLPLLYVISGANKLFEGDRSINPHFTTACLLMVYEYFAVQCAIWLFFRVKRLRFRNTMPIVLRNDICGKLITAMSVFVLLVAVFFPQYGAQFKSILQMINQDVIISESYAYIPGSFGRILQTLFSICVQFVRVLLPALLMLHCHKKNRGGIGVTLAMLLGCVLQFFFLTSTFAEAIVSALALILYYISLYPERKQKAFLLMLLTTIGVMGFYFYLSYRVKAESSTGLYSGKDPLSFAAAIINAYFTGVDNVSAVLNVPRGVEADAFRADILGAIPFNTTLFGGVGHKFQYYFNAANSSYGQIPPTIGVGYYYLGGILSPLFSVLFVGASMHFHRMAQQNKDSLKFVSMIFCSIVFALGTVMYNLAITLQWFFSWGLLMILITQMSATGKKEVVA